jgi:hypothetical protein
MGSLRSSALIRSRLRSLRRPSSPEREAFWLADESCALVNFAEIAAPSVPTQDKLAISTVPPNAALAAGTNRFCAR